MPDFMGEAERSERGQGGRCVDNDERAWLGKTDRSHHVLAQVVLRDLNTLPPEIAGQFVEGQA